MTQKAAMFASYCYGPADIVSIHLGDNTLRLELRDSAGRSARAVYHGCVYRHPEQNRAGLHLSLVQQVSAGQLLQHPEITEALRKNTGHTDRLLAEWERAGLRFYLHRGSFREEEFLVVARGLSYRETE